MQLASLILIPSNHVKTESNRDYKDLTTIPRIYNN